MAGGIAGGRVPQNPGAYGFGSLLGLGGNQQTENSSRPGAQYTPVTPNVYTPAFSSVQTNQAPTVAPTPAQQVQQAGLQALMANMMAQYQNVPGALAMTQQRPQMQMPRFSAPALAYRPNMQAIQNNLGRIAPAVRPAPPADAGDGGSGQPALQSYYDSNAGG